MSIKNKIKKTKTNNMYGGSATIKPPTNKIVKLSVQSLLQSKKFGVFPVKNDRGQINYFLVNEDGHQIPIKSSSSSPDFMNLFRVIRINQSKIPSALQAEIAQHRSKLSGMNVAKFTIPLIAQIHGRNYPNILLNRGVKINEQLRQQQSREQLEADRLASILQQKQDRQRRRHAENIRQAYENKQAQQQGRQAISQSVMLQRRPRRPLLS